MFELKISRNFKAAHALKGEVLHSHNWRIEVTLVSDKVDNNGCCVDFRDVDSAIDKVIAPFVNKSFNDIMKISSTELIAKYFFEKFSCELNKKMICLKQITVFEDANHSASYLRSTI